MAKPMVYRWFTVGIVSRRAFLFGSRSVGPQIAYYTLPCRGNDGAASTGPPESPETELRPYSRYHNRVTFDPQLAICPTRKAQLFCSSLQSHQRLFRRRTQFTVQIQFESSS